MDSGISSKYEGTLYAIQSGTLPGEWRYIPFPQREYSRYTCLLPIDDKPIPCFEEKVNDGIRQYFFHPEESGCLTSMLD